MSFGQIIQIAECLVVIYCGIKLSVGSEYMRWSSKWAKGLFAALVLFDVSLQVANTFYYKFSEIGIMIHSVYIFIVLYVFYYIKFWQLFVQNFLFWNSYILSRYIILCVSGFLEKVPINRYIKELYGEPWQLLHVIGMIMTVTIVLSLYYKKKGKVLIECKSNRNYIMIAVLVIAEEIVLFLLFNPHILTIDITNRYIFLIIQVLWSFFCGALFIVVLKAYFDENHQKQISELNYIHLKKYYEQLQDMYNEKKVEMHDVETANDMLIDLLKDGNVEEVIKHLNDKKQLAVSEQKNKYTGIDIIDLILDCKIKEAKQFNIDVKLDIDAFFCPLEPTDMCVVLGNLFDNAIEATRELPIEKRIIKVKVRTPNSVFILEMGNPYEGKRKKIDGRYRTTKTDKTVNGLGLDSIEWILSRSNGWLEIEDRNNHFVAVVSMFLKRGQIKKERRQF